MNLQERFSRAQLIRDTYPEFKLFCRDAMQFLGFEQTWMQDDICDYMQYGGNKLCVQAQRGEAKSTIACIFGVWNIIQNPTTRILLISASAEKAIENAVLIQGLIKHWEILSYLVPDRNAGDRTAVNAFDVHWALKGVNKSPTVRCMGITASLQGYRADLLIPDDVESNKNSRTATERAKLVQLTKEFTSIVSDADGSILYLGTPQTKDSIYNALPSRGFSVRVWPGRFPSDADIAKSGSLYAPSILERIGILGPKCQTGAGIDGTRGWPTDPARISEADHIEKELDQGPETYELQFMLNTALSDASRQQLRLRDLIFLETDPFNVPDTLDWTAATPHKLNFPQFAVPEAELYTASAMSEGRTALTGITMSIDPAGAGGDELAYAIGGAAGPYVHLLSWGGFLGGVCDANLGKVVELCKRYNVTTVYIEKNMGHGTVTLLVQNYFNAVVDGKKRLAGVGISEGYVSGQKERRIIDIVRPVMQRHRLVVHRSAVDSDTETTRHYPAQERNLRSGFFQMQHLTTDRGSLDKDDRIDVLSLLVHQLQGFLVIDEDKAERHRQAGIIKNFINNPMGKPNQSTGKRKHAALRRRGL